MPLMGLMNWRKELWQGCHLRAPFIGVSGVKGWRTKLKEHLSLQCVDAAQRCTTENVCQGVAYHLKIVCPSSLFSSVFCCHVLMPSNVLGNCP
jgi:hypothetical protein